MTQTTKPYCEAHNVALTSKRVFRLGNFVVTPDAAYMVISKELPHHLPWNYSEVRDEHHAEPVDLLICEVCQSQVSRKIADYRKRMAQMERGNEQDA